MAKEKRKITLNSLANAPSRKSMSLENKEWRTIITVELVDACCQILKYHWGSLFNIHEGYIYIHTYNTVIEDWEPEEKISYCPFCGKEIIFNS